MPPYTQADVDKRLAKPCSPHDCPGAVYGLEVAAPDGTIVLKAGRSNCPSRRVEEWQKQCFMDKIGLKWEISTEHAIKLDRGIEGLVHAKFKEMGAWLERVHCESCHKNHIEKFNVEKLGGFGAAADIVRGLAGQMEAQGE
ncbi:hypothetical protein FB451DRAFT_1194374 [Mycena latifolia]|nr:hypothetical protein FB451DRAFT_1194374 [Mycena latifolia]